MKEILIDAIFDLVLFMFGLIMAHFVIYGIGYVVNYISSLFN